MTGIGLGFFLLYTAASATLSLLGHDMGIFITGDWKLPVIMVGFGMFLLFDRVTFHNRVINRIAQSAFAVYLITDYAASEKLLWARLFNLQDLSGSPRKRHQLEFINSLLNTNTRDGKVHLSPMIDCHGGEIIVCTAGFSPDAALADRMLVRAVESLQERAKPLVHSNCAAEGFFGRIKVEAVHPRTLGRTHTRRSAHLG